MKKLPRFLGWMTILALPAALAQPVPPPIGPEKNVFYSLAPGAAEQTFSYVASGIRIEGGLVKNAPYSAQATTETTQRLADGNRISRKTTANLYRDSEGRTRREETRGTAGASPEPIQTVFITDPVAQTSMVLDSGARTVRKMPKMRFLPAPSPDGAAAMKVAAEMDHVMIRKIAPPEAGLGEGPSLSDMAAIKALDESRAIMRKSASPDAANANQNVQKESLGTQSIEGVRAEGTRTTLTIPAGAIGNELPIQIVSERWYSPELQTVVMSKHSDPRMGDTVYRLTGINRAEPARALFEAPADYTVMEEKPYLMKTK